MYVFSLTAIEPGLRNIVIEASESKSVIHTCADNRAWSIGATRITCNPGTKGRSLKIRNKADLPFHLCYVQVFGVYGKL